MDFDMIRFSDFLVKKRRELNRDRDKMNDHFSDILCDLVDEIILEFKDCLLPLDGDDMTKELNI